jgi:hypothetical protein
VGEISVASLESFREQGLGALSELDAPALPTVIVQHTDCPDLLWSLRLTEFFGDVSGQFGYQPNVDWRSGDSGALSYADSPVSPDPARRGTAGCQLRAAGDSLTFELVLTNNSDESWPDCWGWLCLAHCWAQAFQANCELPAGPADNPWVPVNSLRAPLERWLKWCPVEEHAQVAERIGGGKSGGMRWQAHIHNRRGAVRAWRAGGARQQFIELTSPDAVILGWSHHPCTDMGLYFGTLAPGQTGRATGQLTFSEKPYTPI